MLRLHQTFGAHAGRVRELDKDVIRFGRLPSCDFAFDPHADLDASGAHAEIRKENGDWVLLDIGSRNGTLVDGRPIKRLVLRGGEEIEFGTGGPRVRVELLGALRGAPTGPATPFALPPSPSPAPIPPSQPPPAYLPSPLPPPPSTPPPVQPSGSPSPKLYGQRTVEQMIQQAVAQHGDVTTRQGGGGGPEALAAPAYDGQTSRIVMFLVGVVGLLLLAFGCLAIALVAIFWMR